MHARPYRALLAVTALVLPISACSIMSAAGGEDSGTTVASLDLTQVTDLVYEFMDSSVPPEHHRSYTITVTANQASVVIDSYGDVLADEQYDVTAEQVADLKDSLASNNIRNCTLPDDDGCAGGTGQAITLSDGQGEVFGGTVYSCANEDSGDLCGDVNSAAEAFLALIPDFDALLDSTREQ